MTATEIVALQKRLRLTQAQFADGPRHQPQPAQ